MSPGGKGVIDVRDVVALQGLLYMARLVGVVGLRDPARESSCRVHLHTFSEACPFGDGTQHDRYWNGTARSSAGSGVSRTPKRSPSCGKGIRSFTTSCPR